MNTAYAATKYAIVGLSTSLREEAAGLGVNVSVVCPGFVRTGIFDSMTVVSKFTDKDFMANYLSSNNMIEAADCARIILRGVERNRAIIPVTGFARRLWWLYRLCPPLLSYIHRGMVQYFRESRSEQ
jgi:short-subunit dehydrogenase